MRQKHHFAARWKLDFARSPGPQASEGAEKRALATPGRAIDNDMLSLCNIEIWLGQRNAAKSAGNGKASCGGEPAGRMVSQFDEPHFRSESIKLTEHVPIGEHPPGHRLPRGDIGIIVDIPPERLLSRTLAKPRMS